MGFAVLALLGAGFWGVGDFLGGLASRRAHVLTVLAIWFVGRIAADPFEYDFSKLRDQGALREGGPAWWDDRVDDLFGDHLTPTVILARDEAQAHGRCRPARRSR